MSTVVMPPVRFTRLLGRFGRARTDRWVLVGQDGGQSVPLHDGSTLFLFSDTLLTQADRDTARPRVPPPFHTAVAHADHFLANCAALGGGDDIRPAVAELRYFCDDDGFPVELLPATAAERAAQLRFWPLHGIELDGVVQLFYLGVQTIDPESSWGFRNVGIGIATLDPVSGAVQRHTRHGDWRLWGTLSEDFHFGVQVVRHNEHALVFGSHRHGFEIEAVVGRAPLDALADPAAYTYWRPDDETWVGDPRAAGSLGPCGSDYSVSFNRWCGGYLMTYLDSFTKQLTMRLAPEIWGPYSNPVVVGRVPHRAASEFVYLAFEHPRFSVDDGRRVYVSYCEPDFQLNGLLEIEFG